MTAPGRAAYDAVVVGAGAIGLSCAWRCAQRGLSVLVVERDEPGAGASGVAAGMLAPVTEAEFGEQALLELNLTAARAWPHFAAELEQAAGAPSGYARSGALVVAADRDDAEELRRLHAFQRSLGLEVEWLGSRECRALEPRLSPRIAGGILARDDHQADPRVLTRALTAALRRAGGELRTGAAVDSVVDDGRVRGVRLAGGETVEAATVVIAAGPWSAYVDGVPADARPPVRPVKGQILRLRAGDDGPLAERLIRTPRCYVVPRASGEVVIGATQEERGFDTRVTADGVHRLLEDALEVLPDAAELELVEASARLRPGSPDNAPLIGEHGAEGLVWACGHHRNGVLLAPPTADAVAAIACGGEPPETVAPFAPGRFNAGSPAAPIAGGIAWKS